MHAFEKDFESYFMEGNHFNYGSKACPIFSIDLAKYWMSRTELYMGGSSLSLSRKRDGGKLFFFF
ncbi:MAG: hypothetical protein FJZ62_05355 [Chlamydiae bacterium]|nr:hypothetical protein [Chlamydiota bacterium]